MRWDSGSDFWELYIVIETIRVGEKYKTVDTASNNRGVNVFFVIGELMGELFPSTVIKRADKEIDNRSTPIYRQAES